MKNNDKVYPFRCFYCNSTDVQIYTEIFCTKSSKVDINYTDITILCADCASEWVVNMLTKEEFEMLNGENYESR